MKTGILFTIFLVLLCSTFAFSQGNTPATMGAWNITYTLDANASRTLIFTAMTDGTGAFRMPGPRSTATSVVSHNAVWAKPHPGTMNFSGEVWFQVSNCCRETGTLMFKGTMLPTGQIVGRAIFVVDTPILATTPAALIRNGTFVANPVPVIAVRTRTRGSRKF